MDETTKILLLEGTVIFSLIWSVGATGDTDTRRKFDEFFRTLALGGKPEGYEDYVPAAHPALTITLPPPDGGSTVYDYTWDKPTNKWRLWTDTIPQLAIPNDSQFSDIIIPTADSARCGLCWLCSRTFMLRYGPACLHHVFWAWLLKQACRRIYQS